MGTFADYISMSGYTPTSNVISHSKIDIDIKMIDEYLQISDYNNSMLIYMNGHNSIKSSGKFRTLSGFSTSAKNKMISEEIYQLYSTYYNDTNYSDNFIHNIYNSNLEDIIKKELILKSIQYQNVWMYIIHELEDAINDCIKGDLTLNDGGPHAWDEAWAFYTGSLQNNNKKGYSVYSLSDKRCENFGTCSNSVNKNLINLYKAGNSKLQNMKCNDVIKIKNDIIKYMIIPLIQSLLKYIYESSLNNGIGKNKERAEGFIFSKTILPIIDSCNTNVANLIKNNMNLEINKYNYINLKKNIESIYTCLNIKCEEIGGLLIYDNEYHYGMEQCENYIEIKENELNLLTYTFPVYGIIIIVIILNISMVLIVILIVYRRKYKKLEVKYQSTLNNNINISSTELN